jgi:hypothetical protein
MDEGRKHVLAILAGILAARTLAQYEGGTRFLQLWAPSPMRSDGQRRSGDGSTSGGQPHRGE